MHQPDQTSTSSQQPTPRVPLPHFPRLPQFSLSIQHLSILHLPISPTCHRLASSNRRPGVDILRRNRPVKLEQDAGVGGLVGTRERDQLAAGVERAGAAGDAELGAGDVELGAADAAGAVKGNVLDAEKVLAVGEAGGEADGDFGFAF